MWSRRLGWTGVLFALVMAPAGGLPRSAPSAIAPAAARVDVLDRYLRVPPPPSAALVADGPQARDLEAAPSLRGAAVPAHRAAPRGVRASAALAAGFVWPARGAVTSVFGWRQSRPHQGIDIAAAYGAPIYAAGAGRVVYAGWYGGYGRTVILEHGGGLTTLYGHAARLLVRSGQAVAAGEEIARVGSSGWSNGPHLHFEVHLDGRAVDPLAHRLGSSASVAPPSGAGRYSVQVGAYRLVENARARAAEMRRAGFAATVTRAGSLYLVRVGYPDRASSERAVAALRRLGFEAFVAR
jgi:murein DD-endopeptidase MepM/ murein hydrolase activator NlpD